MDLDCTAVSNDVDGAKLPGCDKGSTAKLQTRNLLTFVWYGQLFFRVNVPHLARLVDGIVLWGRPDAKGLFEVMR